jgi:hypothetical protein
MIPTINLERNLRPFEKVCEHFHLLPPNRFIVMPSERRSVRKNNKHIRWKYDKIGHYVIGTLNDRFTTSGTFSMNELSDGRLMRTCSVEPNDLQSLPPRKMSNLEMWRSEDAAICFELNSKDVRALKKVARQFQFVRNQNEKTKKIKSKVRLNIMTDNQIVRLKMCDGQGGATFCQTQIADVNAPFAGSISADTLKSLRLEDYTVTIDVKGIIEMIGVESGLVFLIPTIK